MPSLDVQSVSRPAMIADRAVVSPSATIGAGAQVWHDSFIEPGAVIGARAIIGRGVTIGSGVRVGADSKVQNGALVYEPAEIASGVFIGPGAILTNDHLPRAITPHGRRKTGDDWQPVGVTIEHGASIGAGAVCVGPVVIGRWALVGAGAVVTHDVAAFSLVVGNPARRVGWVGATGHRLIVIDETHLTCPTTGDLFILTDGTLQEVHA